MYVFARGTSTLVTSGSPSPSKVVLYASIRLPSLLAILFMVIPYVMVSCESVVRVTTLPLTVALSTFRLLSIT